MHIDRTAEWQSTTRGGDEEVTPRQPMARTGDVREREFYGHNSEPLSHGLLSVNQ